MKQYESLDASPRTGARRARLLLAAAPERVEHVVPERARREREPFVLADERGQRREVLDRLDVGAGATCRCSARASAQQFSAG
jgi:hypothetical protein